MNNSVSKILDVIVTLVQLIDQENFIAFNLLEIFRFHVERQYRVDVLDSSIYPCYLYRNLVD
jgi:hypothetical protein